MIMRKLFKKKIIAYAVSAALVLGGLPMSSAVANAEDTAETQNLLVQGKVVDGDNGAKEVILAVKEDSSLTGTVTYEWLAAKDREDLEKLDDLDADTVGTSKEYKLNSQNPLDPDNKFLRVIVKGNGKIMTSHILEIKDKVLEIDYMANAEVKDGIIVVTNNDSMLQYSESSTYNKNSGHNFDNWQYKPSTDGKYIVMYDPVKWPSNCGLDGLYAVYTVENSTATPSATASASAAPTSAPSTPPITPPSTAPTTPSVTTPSTSTSTPTVAPTVAPTPTPAVTAPSVPTATPTAPATTAPTVTPTASPTSTPEATVSPAPADTAEPVHPTQMPEETTNPISPENKDMSKAGTEVNVGGVTYKSNGSGTVTFTKPNTTKGTVTVPSYVQVNGTKYPVTTVGAGAFSGSNVKKVTIGKNVKTIGTGAFKNCKKLTKVTFPAGMQTVGKESFSGCTKLGSISLPSSVKTLGSAAFKNCKSMKKFTLGKAPKKTKKGKVMFGGTSTNKVSIGANALANCLKLREVIINSQVTKIGNTTFKNCKKLASILVRSLKLQTVGKKALKGVNNCKISVPNTRLKKYRTLFTNKGQGKKVVIAKV